MYVFVLPVHSADNFLFLFYVHQELAQNVESGILVLKQSSYFHPPPGVGTPFTSLTPKRGCNR